MHPSPDLSASIYPQPSISIETVVPHEAKLAHDLDALSVNDRTGKVQAYLDQVKVQWRSGDTKGHIRWLNRARAVEKEMQTSTAKPPDGLLSKPITYREYVLLDAELATGTKIGRDLALGALQPKDVCATGAAAANAIMQLRRIDDTLKRVETCACVASKTGMPPAQVMALFRVEGDMDMPPSKATIKAGIPSGRRDADCMMKGWSPELSHLVLAIKNNCAERWFARRLTPDLLSVRLPLDSLVSGPMSLLIGLSPTDDAIDQYYYHTEQQNAGGFYPVGVNTVWHGGLHLHAPEGAPIHAIANGKLVAARLTEEASAKKNYGSTNFILTEHDFGGTTFFCLYCHVHWEPLNRANAHLQDITWLKAADGTGPDPAILGRLRSGAVCYFNKPIAAGDKLWTVGQFGSSGSRAPMVHWEIFSADLCPGSWQEAVDPDNDFNCDTTKIHELSGKVIDKNGDGNWKQDEIVDFFHHNATREKLRLYACKFISEFAIDWPSAVEKLKGRYSTRGLAERIAPYNFWQDAKSASVPLPGDPHVWHYNPIRFVWELRQVSDHYKELMTMMWFIQLAGLDKVHSAPGIHVYPKRGAFAHWSDENWVAAGSTTGGGEAGAAKRWDEATKQLTLEIVNAGGGDRETLMAQIEDPVTFVSVALGEGAMFFKKLQRVEALVGDLPAGHPLAGTKLDLAITYLLYNAEASIHTIILSALVYAQKSAAYHDIKQAIAGTPVETVVHLAAVELPRKKGTKREIDDYGNSHWSVVVEWLKSANHLALISQFIITADMSVWPSWHDPRSNMTRFRMLLDYYQRLVG